MRRKDRRVQIPAGNAWYIEQGVISIIFFFVMGYVIKWSFKYIPTNKQDMGAFISIMVALVIALMIFFGLLFIYLQLDLFAFAYCVFDEKGVTLRPLFRRKIRLEYDKCVTVGVTSWTAVLAYTGTPTNTYHDIYLSYKRIPRSEREPTFSARISKDCIVIGFRKKTYRYLMEHLPPDLAGKLRWSDDALYEKIMGDRKPNRDK